MLKYSFDPFNKNQSTCISKYGSRGLEIRTKPWKATIPQNNFLFLILKIININIFKID